MQEERNCFNCHYWDQQAWLCNKVRPLEESVHAKCPYHLFDDEFEEADSKTYTLEEVIERPDLIQKVGAERLLDMVERWERSTTTGAPQESEAIKKHAQELRAKIRKNSSRGAE